MDHSKPDLRNFIDDVNQRLPLSSIIGQKVKLRKKGHEFQGLCPFHNEKTPSFYVNDGKGFYHCFGCGAHGDAIGFLQETQRLTFMEALEQYAQAANLSLPQFAHTDIPPEKGGVRERLRALSVESARFFRDQLSTPLAKNAVDYLHARDISQASIKKFGLGYAPPGNEIRVHLTESGFTPEEAVDAGVLIASQDSGRDAYARFRERIMFPIFDNQSRVIGFGGRTLRDDPAKYINCPETPLFIKGLNLYGMNFALKAQTKSSRVIVAEGYFDVIQLHQNGFHEAVAPMGTAITEDQLHLLWRRWEDVVLCMDGDTAGRKAAERAIERALPLLNAQKRLFIILLDKGDDPDTYLRTKGATQFRQLLDNAPAVSEFIWTLHANEITHPRPERLASLRAKLNTYTQAITDPLTREEFSHFFKTCFTQRFRSFPTNKGRSSTHAPTHVPKMLINRLFVQECLLLRLIVLRPALLEEITDELMNMSFSSENLESFRDAVLGFYESQADSDTLAHYLQNHPDYAQWGAVFDEGLAVHHGFLHADKPMKDVKKAWFEFYSLYKNLRNIESDLKNAINDLHNTMDPKAWERVKMLQEMAEALRDDGSSDI